MTGLAVMVACLNTALVEFLFFAGFILTVSSTLLI